MRDVYFNPVKWIKVGRMKNLEKFILALLVLNVISCSVRQVGSADIRVEPPASTTPTPIVSQTVHTFGGD